MTASHMTCTLLTEQGASCCYPPSRRTSITPLFFFKLHLETSCGHLVHLIKEVTMLELAFGFILARRNSVSTRYSWRCPEDFIKGSIPCCHTPPICCQAEKQPIYPDQPQFNRIYAACKLNKNVTAQRQEAGHCLN